MTELVPPLPELIGRARRLAAQPRRSILGITGAPGSGKSTLAGELVAALAPSAVAVPMDGFHLANAELDRLGRSDRKGAPDTFDAAGYVALLHRVRERKSHAVYAPAFDRALEEPVAGSIAVASDVRLVVTEGNYLLLDEDPWSGVRSVLDEVWYVEVDEVLRLERLIARHIRHGKSPSAARAWALGPDARNAERIAATREQADLVVAGLGRQAGGWSRGEA